MKILSFDQATKITGWALLTDEKIIDYGLIQRTSKTLQSPREKLWSPQMWMRAQIVRLVIEHLPNVVALEYVFLGENVKTLIALSEFRGSVIGAIEDSGLQIEIVTVTSPELMAHLHLKIGTNRAAKKARSQFFATADVFGTVQASDGSSVLLSDDISDAINIARVAEGKLRYSDARVVV